MTIDQKNDVVENTTEVADNQDINQNDNEVKETLHLNKVEEVQQDDSTTLSDAQAKKLRDSVEHKVGNKYKYQLNDLSKQNNDLSKKNEDLKNQLLKVNQNDDFYKDNRLGYIPRNMSVEEYSTALDEKIAKERIEAENFKLYQEITETYKTTSKKIPDFENVINHSLQNQLITSRELILGSQVKGGYEVIHDLAKNNPQKLLEIRQLSEPLVTARLAELAKDKFYADQKANISKSDHPINPLDESSPNNVSYSNSNFKDGYALWKKKNTKN